MALEYVHLFIRTSVLIKQLFRSTVLDFLIFIQRFKVVLFVLKFDKRDDFDIVNFPYSDRYVPHITVLKASVKVLSSPL